MRIISKRTLREFWEKHPDAQQPLSSWFKVASHAEWKTPVDVKAVYSSADYTGQFTIFNVGGNKYRLIAAIHYNTGTIFVRRVFTHAEYDKWNARERKKG